MAVRIAKWVLIGVVTLMLLAGAIVLGLNTGSGKSFLLRQVGAFNTESGINLRAERIEGSLYGRMTLIGVEVRDQKGAFLTARQLTVDWRPFAYARNVVDVRELASPEIVFTRSPELKPVKSDPNAPTLPDLDIIVGKLAIDRLVVGPAVTGQRHIVAITGKANIADGRAQVTAHARALTGPGLAGGDIADIVLDAVPDADKLIVDARVSAPAGGLIDGYAKLGKPLALTIGGRGSWKAWQGKALAQVAGASLADLAITGRDGTFTVTGPTNPGLILTGPAQRIVAPHLDVDLRAALADRRVDTVLTLRSDAMAIDVNGLVDLANSRFSNLRAAAILLKPGSILDNLAGRDVRFVGTLNGAFSNPDLDYRLSAARIAFGETAAEGLVAVGHASVDSDRILVPVAASAKRITGLNEATGRLLTNVRIDGDLAYSDGRILSDNLHLRSDRIDATAIVLADPAKGRYTGALKGRVNDYLVDGLGRINLTTDAKLVTGPKGGFGIVGTFRVVTRQLTNAAVAAQLGGPAVATARFGFDENGIASLQLLRMDSPGFRITGGGGSYRPDGRIDFRAQAVSRQYGPLTLLATGSVARPRARLYAERPNVGIQLSKVEAELNGTAAGYQVKARGGSPYGPFSANVLIRSGRGPLTIDIAQSRFAGIDFRGTVTQTRAGPFAGALTLAGSGLNGNVQLAAVGANQRAAVNVTAAAARIPGDAPITIGSGTIRAVAILYPNAPALDADFKLANVVQGATSITNAQGRVKYRNGSGTGAVVADGRSGVPFNVAAQAQFAPDRIVANARGKANGIDFRLASPAVATRAAGTWTLQPATVVVPQGQARIMGSYGKSGISAQSQLDNLDLSLVQAFAPDLGLGGKASGTIDYVGRGNAVPAVNARMTIARFTRTAAYTMSTPVDIALLGTLSGSGGDLRAVIRRGGTPVGRLQARLAPLGEGAGIADRLLAAPLSGGIRYSGPAEVLWTLTGIADQQLNGPIAVAADFGGRVDRPTLNGIIRADSLRYENQTYGTVISALAIGGRFTRSEIQITSLQGRAGRGTISGQGSIGLDTANGFPIDLKLALNNAQLARSNALGATVTGDLTIANGPSGGRITGDLRVPEARYEIIRQGGAEIAELTGIRRKNALASAQGASPAPGFASRFALDIRVRADNQIFVSGMGLEAEWSTDMRVTGNASAPRVIGTLDVVRGTYSFAGKRFELADNGRITFDGIELTNPQIALVASTTVNTVSATINISGRAQNPQIAFSSTPTLPQDEVLSRLLFGSSITSLSPIQAVQLAAALNSLRGSGGGLNPLGKLRSVSGASRLRVLGADEATGRGTALSAGKYISKDIYVEVITDARGFTATQLEISLSKVLSILSQTGSFGGSNAQLRYSKDY